RPPDPDQRPDRQLPRSAHELDGRVPLDRVQPTQHRRQAAHDHRHDLPAARLADRVLRPELWVHGASHHGLAGVRVPRRRSRAGRRRHSAGVLQAPRLVLSVTASDQLREEERESRWEAAPAILVVIAMQLLLALVSRDQNWMLWVFPWWVWLVPVVAEVLLLVPLAWQRPRRRLEPLGRPPPATTGPTAPVAPATPAP